MSDEKLNWDCDQFEADMEKEISNRKMLGSLQTTKRFSEIRISDQFFIFGIPPNTKKQSQNTILVAFPPYQQPNIPINNILCLSNPNAENTNTNSKTKFTDIFPLIEFGSSPVSETGIVDEFVFQYNAGPVKMYGICVVVQPSRAVKSATNPFYSTESTKKNKFCFCMISKIPIFNVHFTFLHYLIGLSNGTIPSTENLKNKISFDFSSKTTNVTSFEDLEINGLFGQYPQIEIPEDIQTITVDHLSKTLFSSPAKLTPYHIIHFPPPTTPIQKLILYSSLDTLFSVLSVSDIIDLLTALILDAQVLVIGSSMQEVSMTVYGLYALLNPFNYCGVVMPILPNNEDYLNLLNSPTPFIFGLPNIPKLRKMSFLESTCIVNLDKRKLTGSNFFPKYPNFKEVVAKMNDHVFGKKGISNNNSGDLADLSKLRREKCKSTMVDGKKQQIRSKPNFANSRVSKPPPIVSEDDQKEQKKEKESDTKVDDNDQTATNVKSLQRPSRRRHTVTKNELSNEESTESNANSNSNSSNNLSDFPVFDRKPSMPEISNDDNPYRFPLEFTKKLNHKVVMSMENMDKVLDILHEPLDFIFSDTLNGYFVTNANENITIFNQSLFLASVKQEDLSFYEFLLESQTFQDYVEIKLDEFTKSKTTDPNNRRCSSFGQKGRKRAATVRKVTKVID